MEIDTPNRIRQVYDLRISFHADDEAHATRKLRALLKYLLRTWGVRCERLTPVASDQTDNTDECG